MTRARGRGQKGLSKDGRHALCPADLAYWSAGCATCPHCMCSLQHGVVEGGGGGGEVNLYLRSNGSGYRLTLRVGFCLGEFGGEATDFLERRAHGRVSRTFSFRGWGWYGGQPGFAGCRQRFISSMRLSCIQGWPGEDPSAPSPQATQHLMRWNAMRVMMSTPGGRHRFWKARGWGCQAQ